jgi:hypothetical protein
VRTQLKKLHLNYGQSRFLLKQWIEGEGEQTAAGKEQCIARKKQKNA